MTPQKVFGMRKNLVNPFPLLLFMYFQLIKETMAARTEWILLYSNDKIDCPQKKQKKQTQTKQENPIEAAHIETSGHA